MGGPGPVAGRVRTVQAGPRQDGKPAQHIAAAAIEAAEAGDVLVIANDGRTDVSCWGGILTLAARRNGVGGVVIDGACRDIAESAEHGFPVFGRAVVPVSARGRIVQLAMDEPVEFAGLAVHPGDVVLADRTAWSSSAPPSLDRVVTLAERIVARESAMAEAVRRPAGDRGHARQQVPDDRGGSAVTCTAFAPACRVLNGHRVGRARPAGPARLAAGHRAAVRRRAAVRPAFTVRYVTAGSPPGTVGDYLDDVPPGGVVVLDNGGRTDCTVWGDILTAMADQRGVAGTVIDGVCRDVQRALGLVYPIYSRGRFMRTGKDRVEVSDVGRPGHRRRRPGAPRRPAARRRRRRDRGPARDQDEVRRSAR